MGKYYYHYPPWVRIWHLLNAILCIILIITGLGMELAGEAPDAAGSTTGSFSLHSISGIILTVSYLFFVAGNILTANGRHYILSFRGLWMGVRRQAGYYLSGQFKHEKAPFPTDENRKFNPLQQVTYAALMYIIFPLLIIAGWVIMFNDLILKRTQSGDSMELVRHSHEVMGYMIIAFLFIHLLAIMMNKPLSGIRGIITGWKESE